MSLDRYEWYAGVDPGTTTVFAGLFIAYDRYTSTPYFLDEIYETKAANCTVNSVLPQFLSKMRALNGHGPSWHLFCDSAAAWFIAEAADRYGLSFAPTQKRVGDKLEGISLIKDIFLTRKHFISDRCQSLKTELSNYKTNARGVPVKEWDHLIDLVRYFLKFAGFTVQQSEYLPPEERLKAPVRPARGYTTEAHIDDNSVDSLLWTPDMEFGW